MEFKLVGPLITLYTTSINVYWLFESVWQYLWLNVLLLLQIKTPAQLEAAFAFVTVTGSENLDINKFEEACGVGILCFFHSNIFWNLYCHGVLELTRISGNRDWGLPWRYRTHCWWNIWRKEECDHWTALPNKW